MRLQVPKVDGRTTYGKHVHYVKDLDSGNVVGTVDIGSVSPDLCRSINLFDNKYRGEFESHEECMAFAKGVEAVLNHMVATAAKT